MMRSIKEKLKSKKAQSALEFALLSACVVGALIAMQHYIKLSVQGKIRQSSDEVGRQYEPGKTEGKERLWMKGTIVTEVKTLSEAELTNQHLLYYDLNEKNGIEDDVFGFTVKNTLSDFTTTMDSKRDIMR